MCVISLIISLFCEIILEIKHFLLHFRKTSFDATETNGHKNWKTNLGILSKNLLNC